MADEFNMWVGNRMPSVSDTITIGGVAQDLTGATVKFMMRSEDTATFKVNAAATIVDAPTGSVRYDWALADTDTAGDYVAWFRVTISGKDQDTPEFPVYINDHASPTTNLCTLSDVREYLQKPAADTSQDDVLEELIARASYLINQWTRRMFTPKTTAATKSFEANGVFVNLTPYDVRTVTAVTIDVGAGAVAVAEGFTGYRLGPVSQPNGVYNYLRLASNETSDGMPAIVTVTGDWGFPSVPADVRHACVVTVGLWARREVQAFSSTFNLDEGRTERPEALPSAVQALLRHYRPVVFR